MHVRPQQWPLQQRDQIGHQLIEAQRRSVFYTSELGRPSSGQGEHRPLTATGTTVGDLEAYLRQS